MEVSSETKRKVRDFVIGEFGADFIRSVDLQTGYNVFGDEAFILSLTVAPEASFSDKRSQTFNLIRNVKELGGPQFVGLAPIVDVKSAEE